MSYVTFVTFAGLLAGAHLGYAQTDTASATAVASATATATGDVSSGSLAPCGQISSILAEYAATYPSATLPARIDPSLAQSCADSVPLVIDDAIPLLDGISAFLEFQSDLEFKASPPEGYLLAGVDLLGEISNLRSEVESGSITGEIDFQLRLTTIIAAGHDGHLSLRLDGTTVFNTLRPISGLVSVSDDGLSVPKLYLLDEFYNYANGDTDSVSAITEIDGVAADQAINTVAQNTTNGGFQDPDALYNSFLFSWNLGEGTGPSYGLYLGFFGQAISPYTNLTFENGTSVTLDNYVVVTKDFTGVEDGESFYSSFLNATNKYAALTATGTAPSLPTATDELLSTTAYASQTAFASETASAEPTGTTVTQIQGYPIPVVISEDGALSGYFLSDDDLDDTAVLSLRFMTEEAEDSFQNSLTEFLDLCRSNNKTHLVLDLIGNPGGRTALGYDVFKQLFPTLDPYGAGNYRAHEGFRVLGEYITNASTEVMEEQPDNYTAFSDALGTSFLAGETYFDVDNQRFTSFEQYYGPLTAANDYGNYTNLSRYDLPNPQFDEAFGNIVVSGYANESNLAPQPFESENIIMLTDGQCSSTCSILYHFMKYQAKVKAVTVGGRPQDGPMQADGGIKGSLVTTYSSLYAYTDFVYSLADNETISGWENTTIGTIYTLGVYVILRSSSAGAAASEMSVNSRNNIAEGDDSLTPLQFVYEAADCRLYYQPSHILNISNLWATTATQSFGLNGTTVFSGCVNGSTNQSSSLSGDSALYNNGDIQNATEVDSSGEVGGSSGGGDDNAAGGFKTPAITALIIGMAAAILF